MSNIIDKTQLFQSMQDVRMFWLDSGFKFDHQDSAIIDLEELFLDLQKFHHEARFLPEPDVEFIEVQLDLSVFEPQDIVKILTSDKEDE